MRSAAKGAERGLAPRLGKDGDAPPRTRMVTRRRG
jgi:hypothetical protein